MQESIKNYAGKDLPLHLKEWTFNLTVNNMSPYIKRNLLHASKRKSLSNKISNFIIYFINEEPAGFVMYRNEKRGIFLYELQVAEEYRNQGIGTKLLNECKKFECVELCVYRVNESAKRLYLRNEFKVVDEDKRCFYMLYIK